MFQKIIRYFVAACLSVMAGSMSLALFPQTAAAQQLPTVTRGDSRDPALRSLETKANQAANAMTNIAILLAFVGIVFVAFRFWRGDPAAWGHLGYFASGTIILLVFEQLLNWMAGTR